MKINWGTLIIGLAIGYLILPQIVGAVKGRSAA